MPNDFEEMQRRLMAGYPAAESLQLEQIRRQMELAGQFDIAGRLASLDPFTSAHSAAKLAIQDQLRLATQGDWTSRMGLTTAYQEALFAAERFRNHDDAIQKLIGVPNYSALSTITAEIQANIDRQRLVQDTIGSYVEMQARLDRQELIRSAMMGPLADLRTVGLLDSINSAAALEARRALLDYESRFRVPTGIELESIHSAAALATSMVSRFESQIATSLAELHQPFAKIADPFASIASFAEMQGITRAVSSLAPFDNSLTASLRIDLGDWQQHLNPPESLFGNVEARTTFYTERGLRVGLTDFPASAFDASIQIVESDTELVSLADIFGEPIEPDSEEDMAAFVRTNEVQGWILRLESQMRTMIEAVMVAAYGTDWPRQKMPPEVLDAWRAKQEKAAKAGKPTEPLVLFADFTDYERIICNRGHWPHFKAVFQVGDFVPVRESLQRLYLPRVESAHSRMLTQDDYLFAYVELKRLGKAIRAWRKKSGS